MRNCIRPDARSIPMVVPYAGGILSGQGMLVGAFFGVAASDAAQNASVDCETRGEFELTKEPALAISQGARVFWDNTNRRITTTATPQLPGRALHLAHSPTMPRCRDAGPSAGFRSVMAALLRRPCALRAGTRSVA